MTDPFMMLKMPPPSTNSRRRFCFEYKRFDGDAGWSSPVARQAHNLKVAGSNPAPATNFPLTETPAAWLLFRKPARSCFVETAKTRLVVVGGGFGGLTFCQCFEHPKASVTVVDRTNHHLFQPLLYQVATAGLAAPDIAQPIRSILSGKPRLE